MKQGIEDSYSSLAMILKIIFCMRHVVHGQHVLLSDNMGENTH